MLAAIATTFSNCFKIPELKSRILFTLVVLAICRLEAIVRVPGLDGTALAAFFERNAERMRYARFRAQKLFVGSGVVEAGCKTVIGRRLKMSGMFWTIRGANAIIALRCNRLSGKFEDYWESRHAVAA